MHVRQICLDFNFGAISVLPILMEKEKTWNGKVMSLWGLVDKSQLSGIKTKSVSIKTQAKIDIIHTYRIFFRNPYFPGLVILSTPEGLKKISIHNDTNIKTQKRPLQTPDHLVNNTAQTRKELL